MRKLFVFLIFFLLAIASAATVEVTRTFSETEPGGTMTVTFSFEPSGSITGFDLADLIPVSFAATDWSATGYAKVDISFDSSTRDYSGETFRALHWKFNKPFSSKVTLTYTISSVPAGDHKFLAIWTYPGGFNQEEETAVVKKKVVPQIVCGNGACEATESCTTCPADCGACPVVSHAVCGDAKCEATESCTTCPGDCGYCPSEKVIDMKETSTFPDLGSVLAPLGNALPIISVAFVLIVLLAIAKATILAPKHPKTDSYMKGASQAIQGAVKGDFSTLAPSVPAPAEYPPLPPEPSLQTPSTISTEERIRSLQNAVNRLNRLTDEIGKKL